MKKVRRKSNNNFSKTKIGRGFYTISHSSGKYHVIKTDNGWNLTPWLKEDEVLFTAPTMNKAISYIDFMKQLYGG